LAQEGFDLIRKAQKKYEHTKYKKALHLLDKAEHMDYGFCANAWGAANSSINLLRAKIYMEQQKFQLVRNSLDSIDWNYGTDNIDSIKIRSYQLEFGRTYLRNTIDSALLHAQIDCNTYDCFLNLPLSNGSTIRMKTNSELFLNLLYLKTDQQKVAFWLEHFRKSQSYQIIKENTNELKR
jgi:hypothetical protein